MRSHICCAAFFAVVVLPDVYAADEWPQFRGPDGQGRSEAVGLPLQWSESENVVWKTELPGEGHSSPVISDDQIWLTAAVTKPLTEEEEQRRLALIKNPNGLRIAGALSLQALLVSRSDGTLQKTMTLFEVENPEPKHSLNSYASPTPVTAGEFVYFHFGTYGTACVRRETGDVVWKNNDLHVDHQNGPGSSPIVWNQLLIIHFDGIDQQFITALDRFTGDVVWQKKRSGETDPKPEFQKAYCTPLIVDVNGEPLLISPAANWVYGYDPRDGREIWKAHYGKLGFSTVPRPVVQNDVVFISTSYLQPRMVAVSYTGVGDVTETHVRWMSDKQAPRKPSMIAVSDRLYAVSDNGIATCLKAEDGEELWKARLTGDFSASPLYAEGRIYFFGQNGTTTVLADSAELQELARNQLDDGFMASPAVADRALFLRTEKALYRIENQSGSSSN
ncbi:MAG: PQQ-binding-like beta-propeller repeat protein [Planctomycetaceae bacterium]|nr:PQQ-binding-like beta-propeller repeat protein [Planctomycetaceae bacterium]